MLKFLRRENRGITLVALVITIILLLILAGITITQLTGNGLFLKANDAKIQAEIANIKEQIQTEIYAEQIDNEGEISKSKLNEIFTKYDKDGEIKTNENNEQYIKTKEGYEIKIIDIYDESLSTGGVSVKDIFDKTGNEEGKLHVGDFVNYTAGNWSQSDLDKIANSGAKISPNNDKTTLPSIAFQFGGFQIENSKDENAKPLDSSYDYIKDKSTGEAVTGWRVFDIEDDGTITLISAGCPEDYFFQGSANQAYISEYILTGNTNNSVDANTLGLGSTYVARDWSMYINHKYKVQSVTTLTKAKLDEWFTKYMNIENANSYDYNTFKTIYTTKYESLIDNYSYYWLSENCAHTILWCVQGVGSISGSNSWHNTAMGIRVLITLRNTTKFSEKSIGTKTVTSRNLDYTYNIWNLK